MCEHPWYLQVVMDLGRCPIARFPTGDVKLSDVPITGEDLEYAINKVSSSIFYAYFLSSNSLLLCHLVDDDLFRSA
jgi:stage III sporulation protein SpoIIIAA